MAKQTKSKSKAKNPEKIGKGKVTSVQVAFIVDRYLSDNNFTQTRSAFRTEAPDLVSRSPVQEAPKSLLTLGELLDEYIVLKEQKVILDQEKARLEQEKFRVQNLVQGMQMVLNAYNAGGAAAALPPTASSGIAQSSAVVSQIDLTSGSPAGYPVHNTPAIMSTSRLPSTSNLRSFSTPMTNPTTSKRRNSSIDALDAPKTAKRSRNSTINQLKAKGIESLPQPSNAPSNNRAALDVSAIQASPQVDEHNGSPFQGYSVAKCLFNQNGQSPPNNSFPKTPPRPTSSQTGISVSPIETATSTDNVTPHQITSTNCTVITSEMIRVSPEKQIAYYSIERNHRISSSSPIKRNLKRLSKRDHVKGRLDFDGSDTAMNSGKPNSCGISALEPPKAGDIFDMDLPRPDSVTSVKCMTKCIRVLSPEWATCKHIAKFAPHL
ncbi:hypothetical protein RJ639_036062 [Escallonia herrerae]|uniref:LisH domain-containing protein n=1 Tax=Escallonia herrerae TaxID=1293975 RepID=A0AA88WRH7_9ASTE|nr:hypothetical protein RJ639_036062 [Escallonia herrerae]